MGEVFGRAARPDRHAAVRAQNLRGICGILADPESEVARLLNNIDKVVFSTTLTEAAWNGSRLVRDHVPEEVARLKAQPGKGIAVFGSADLAATLMQHSLIDEYPIAVNPVVLGGGTALFRKGAERLNLRLLDTKIFRSGIVELRYARDPGAQP